MGINILHIFQFKKMSIFGPFLGPFGAPIQVFERFSLTLQSSNYQYKSALELLLQLKTLLMGVIYTLQFFSNTQDKEGKKGLQDPILHLDFWVYAPHPRCPPRFILKLRHPLTHFKRESLCQKNCKRGSEPAPVLLT